MKTSKLDWSKKLTFLLIRWLRGIDFLAVCVKLDIFFSKIANYDLYIIIEAKLASST